MIKGVILDFNGTLYLDHDLNHKAWEDTFYSVSNDNSKTYEVFEENIEVLTRDYDYSKAILELFGKEADEKSIEELSIRKESQYINMAKSLNRRNMMNGSPLFLDYLRDNDIAYAIASMAPPMNFDFYYDYLNLKQWFNESNVVCDDGNYMDKNSMYLEAVKRMNIDIKDSLLIEDSPKVIARSKDININQIIYINTKHKEYKDSRIIQEIRDFDDFDYNIFKNNI